ncbi:MAG: hypothetical protein M3527_08885 [Actinomycetota bacterium]|nr:hypothetical protein [Acidimicrobiia bacterium]MDQ3294546.1 hypothetical protein [Actinomycetota bacterium]
MTTALSARDKVRRTVIAIVVVAGVVGIVLALNSSVDIDADGDTVVADQDVSGVLESGDPDAIAAAPPPPDDNAPTRAELVEQLIPSEGSEVLSQVQVGIDLGPGYSAHLVVNGVPIPDDELQQRLPLNQVFFTPGEGLAVDALVPGDNRVRADIYSLADGTDVRSVEWHFRVT